MERTPLHKTFRGENGPLHKGKEKIKVFKWSITRGVIGYNIGAGRLPIQS